MQRDSTISLRRVYADTTRLGLGLSGRNNRSELKATEDDDSEDRCVELLTLGATVELVSSFSSRQHD